MRKAIGLVLSVALAAACFGGCGIGGGKTIDVLSASENNVALPLLDRFRKETGIQVNLHAKGSVDIMTELRQGAPGYDAVWPANSIWITLGDEQGLVKDAQSINTSVVVFGIKESLAEELGYTERADNSVEDLVRDVRSGALSFAMTAATQSNSGFCGYVGFLAALIGNNGQISMEDLESEALREQVKELLAGVNRSSGSSDWLKDLALEQPGLIPAMINYESVFIEANMALLAAGEEPYHIVYPHDGMSLSDSPLGFIEGARSAGKEEDFLKLQEFLLSEESQSFLNTQGRRTGFTSAMGTVPAEWKSWGVREDMNMPLINLPSKDVILRALDLYQTALKRPSATVYCLDFSGSMRGDGYDQLMEATSVIFDAVEARQYMIQNSPEDQIGLIVFTDEPLASYYGDGTEEGLVELYDWLTQYSPGGGTNIYDPAMEAITALEAMPDDYLKSVVLMTDGMSNVSAAETGFDQFVRAHSDIPVFSITFGDADQSQLEPMAEETHARVFDGKQDLIGAFKQVRGYNN